MTEIAIHDYDDGFDGGEMYGRAIQGQIVKFDPSNGSYTLNGALFPETELLAVETRRIAQQWKNQVPVDTLILKPGETLDVDELNRAIPCDGWEIGLDGRPRAPWQLNYAVYLLNAADGDMFTTINSTVGQRIAVERLINRVKLMRTLRVARVVPVVTLDSAMMKTKFGTKMRPEFAIVDWRELGGMSIDTKQIAAPVKPVTTAEIISDDLPF